MNNIIRNILLSGGASVPVSLVSGQGLGQTAINALGTGLGAGIGGLGGSAIGGYSNAGSVGGAMGGNVLANILGTDSNESNIDALGRYGANAATQAMAVTPVVGAYDQTVSQLVQMMPKSKQDEAMAMIQGNMNAASEGYETALTGMPTLSDDEQAQAEAIIQRIVAMQQPQVVVA